MICHSDEGENNMTEQELMADLEAKAQELLPCPFCGARPYVNHIAPHAHSEALQRLIPSLPDHPGSYTIECAACSAGFIAESWERVKKLWNTRRERVWRPIESAPKDGTPVLLQLNEKPTNEGLRGLIIVANNHGCLSMWQFAAPVGYAGIPDDWCYGWCELPAGCDVG